ncbi:hypothetical protein [Tsuneonella troitsensis]|uniref:hypothetical protein n=1 Tax=Tsuneonella troitsensis TaxID=292222 RepID=UPI00070CE74D|nr:hypothetical protein [Tsuneonella troitsensis]
MDAFEQLVAELFFMEGYWVQTSLKVKLTKEEKRQVNRHSSPRWEIDVVAYHAARNEIVALECKSFLDSTGVQFVEFEDGHRSTRYKLFREQGLRETVLNRLALQLAEEGRCQPGANVKLGLVAGKIKRGDETRLRELFDEKGWQFYSPNWLRDQIRQVAADGYANQVSSVVAKLLLREQSPAAGRQRPFAAQEPTSGRIPDTARITLKVQGNPKQPGSQAAQRFEGYFQPGVTTVGAAISAGLRRDDIRYDLRKGFIELVDQ